MTALMPSMEVQVGDFGSDVKSVSIHGATLQWIVSLSKPTEWFFGGSTSVGDMSR